MIPNSDDDLIEAISQLNRVPTKSREILDLCQEIMEITGVVSLRHADNHERFEQLLAGIDSEMLPIGIDVFSKKVSRLLKAEEHWRANDEPSNNDDDPFVELDRCADIVFERGQVHLMSIGLDQLIRLKSIDQVRHSRSVAEAQQSLAELDSRLSETSSLRRLSKVSGLPLMANLRLVMNVTAETPGLPWWLDGTLERITNEEAEWEHNMREHVAWLQRHCYVHPLEMEDSGRIHCPDFPMMEVEVSRDQKSLTFRDRPYSRRFLGLAIIEAVELPTNSVEWTWPPDPSVAPHRDQEDQDHIPEFGRELAAASDLPVVEAADARNWQLGLVSSWMSLFCEYELAATPPKLHIAVETNFEMAFLWEAHEGHRTTQPQLQHTKPVPHIPFSNRAEFDVDFLDGDRLTFRFTPENPVKRIPNSLATLTRFQPLDDTGHDSLTCTFDPIRFADENRFVLRLGIVTDRHDAPTPAAWGGETEKLFDKVYFRFDALIRARLIKQYRLATYNAADLLQEFWYKIAFELREKVDAYDVCKKLEHLEDTDEEEQRNVLKTCAAYLNKRVRNKFIDGYRKIKRRRETSIELNPELDEPVAESGLDPESETLAGGRGNFWAWACLRDEALFSSLNDQEKKIVWLRCDHKNNEEIAGELGISNLATAKKAVSRCFRKIQKGLTKKVWDDVKPDHRKFLEQRWINGKKGQKFVKWFQSYYDMQLIEEAERGNSDVLTRRAKSRLQEANVALKRAIMRDWWTQRSRK